MDRRDVYLDDAAIKAAETIQRVGLAENVSQAIRVALRQFAASVEPRVTPTTP
ncbi:MAG: hypothetical protein HY323_08130 [Betaproteobacteria bacterium]|nr:hypothetical protein [Betaproteobacteria bacterium]